MSFRVFCPKLAKKWPLKWAPANSDFAFYHPPLLRAWCRLSRNWQGGLSAPFHLLLNVISYISVYILYHITIYSDMSDQILYRHMCYIWLFIKHQGHCTLHCWLQNYKPWSRTSKKPSIRPATRPYSGSMIHWIMMNHHSLPSRSRGNILNHFEINWTNFPLSFVHRCQCWKGAPFLNSIL